MQVVTPPNAESEPEGQRQTQATAGSESSSSPAAAPAAPARGKEAAAERSPRARETPALPRSGAAGQAPARGGGAALWLALLALALSAWLGWQQWRQASVPPPPPPAAAAEPSAALEELERRLSQSVQRLVALEGRQRDDQAVNDVLREQLLALQQRLALSEQALADLARQTAPAATAGPGLAEAEGLLAAAETRLLLFADLDGAIRALRLADRSLAASGDPLAGAVRGTLAAELDALTALPRVDGAAVQARLDTLFADLERWPLQGEAAADTSADGQTPWYRALTRLDNYMSIRRLEADAGSDPFPAETARMALRTQVALARLLLLQQRYAELPALLTQLASTLAAFDAEHAGVAAAAQGLQQLQREPFQQPLPQIGLALEELRRLAGLRELGGAGTADPTP